MAENGGIHATVGLASPYYYVVRSSSLVLRLDYALCSKSIIILIYALYYLLVLNSTVLSLALGL